MKVNDPNLTPSGAPATGATRAQETARSGRKSGPGGAGVAAVSNDDVHLSELVRNLRALASESPERQARIESLARAYVQGSYAADPQQTANGMIADMMNHHALGNR